MNLWTEIINTALIGCERKPLSLNGATGELGVLLAQLDQNDREGALLSAAAIVSLYERASALPMKDEQPPLPEVCASDDTPRCGERAAAHLEKILHREQQNLMEWGVGVEFGDLTSPRSRSVGNLTEWVVRVTVGNHCAPEELLQELLELGRILKWSGEKIAPALGARGRWLAAQNPDWAYAVAEAVVEFDETSGDMGSSEQ